MNPTQKQWLFGGIAVAAVIVSAAAASYATRAMFDDEIRPQQARTTGRVQLAQAQPPCDDKNILGTLAGGVAGGVLGNQVGSGSGRTVATVGGAVGGAYLGNEYLPTRNATCR